MPAVGSSRKTSRGPMQQGADQGQPLLPAAREPARPRRSRYGPRPGQLDQLVLALAGLGRRQAVDARVEVHVLLDGQVLVERELLRHVADPRADRLGLAATSWPSTRGRAARRAGSGRTGRGSASSCPSRWARAGRRPRPAATVKLTRSTAVKPRTGSSRPESSAGFAAVPVPRAGDRPRSQTDAESLEGSVGLRSWRCPLGCTGPGHAIAVSSRQLIAGAE